MTEIHVKAELEKNMLAFAEKEAAKGTSSFKIVKNIAKIIKPFAKIRHRQEIMIMVEALDEACDNKDMPACEFWIDKLQNAAKNEALMPFRVMKQIAVDIVNFKQADNNTTIVKQKEEKKE